MRILKSVGVAIVAVSSLCAASSYAKNYDKVVCRQQSESGNKKIVEVTIKQFPSGGRNTYIAFERKIHSNNGVFSNTSILSTSSLLGGVDVGNKSAGGRGYGEVIQLTKQSGGGFRCTVDPDIHNIYGLSSESFDFTEEECSFSNETPSE